jgi:hypothetical protein
MPMSVFLMLPLALAAAMSIASTPVPLRLITRRESAASRTRALMLSTPAR